MSEQAPQLKDGDIVRVMQTNQMVKNGHANKIGRVCHIHMYHGEPACILDGPELTEGRAFCADSLMIEEDADWLRKFHPEFMTWYSASRLDEGKLSWL